MFSLALKLLRKTCLPNNLRVFCLHPREAEILYYQVREYLKNDISLKDNSIIFDIGANIGLFSLWMNELCNFQADIYAFEPIPDVFSALQENARKYNYDKIRPYRVGLGRHCQKAVFSYYPNATAISTMFPDKTREKISFRKTIEKNIDLLPFPLNKIKFLPFNMVDFIFNKITDFVFIEKKIECQIKTISQVIEEQSIERIDLIKIDVEKAELDVLEGIQLQDWSKIGQLVAEVHNVNNRVRYIKYMLQNRGFSQITVEQNPMFEHLDIFNIYAKKSFY